MNDNMIIRFSGGYLYCYQNGLMEGDVENICLVSGKKETDFEYYKDLDVLKKHNFDFSDINVCHGCEKFGVSSGVNELDDWHVPGLQTLHLRIDKSQSGFSCDFDNFIEFKDQRRPLVFEAKIAAHRSRANLVIACKTPDGENDQIFKVSFERKFMGGSELSGYQYVSVPMPISFVEGFVSIGIEFLSCSDMESEHDPYLFITDALLRETEIENEGALLLLDQNDFTIEEGCWLRAPSDLTLESRQVAFLKDANQFVVLPTVAVNNARNFFDDKYYKDSNVDVDFSQIDPFTHYLYEGWKQYRKPNPEFSVREYLLRHPELSSKGEEPLVHYANVGQKKQYSLGVFNEKLGEIWNRSGRQLPPGDESLIFSRAQDMLVPMEKIECKKLAVFVIPEHNAMSGGIYSMFSIADHIRRSRLEHGYDVLVMTRPNPNGLTYLRNTSFKNSETVLRFEQLRLFSEVSELQLHIPEYAAIDFVRNLSPEMVSYLLARDSVHVNILNQNTRLMPDPDQFRDLRRIADTIGQSVSHHAFFGQEFADFYDLPSLLLPAYTDLTPYPVLKTEAKEKLIIYSLDDAPYREKVLEQLNTMSDYRLVEIRDISFDSYMDLATKCLFSVSFGEGFDGYVAQPIYQGGIGFALYNEEFFPDESYRSFENFFDSEQQMIDDIVPTIRRLEKDINRYEKLNSQLREKWDGLYCYNDYVARIGKLIRKEYEIEPQ